MLDFGKVSSRQCEREHSIYGMMLKGHVFKNVTTLSLFFIFRLGLQYVISRNMYELNDRTKEARSETFAPDTDRFYFRRDKNRIEV